MELREATYLEDATSVDESTGVIRGVKIIGHRSKNGRRYSEVALRRAAPLYEGRRSFLNHHNIGGAGPGERDITQLIGSFQNVSERADGLYGDFKVMKSHPFAPVLLEAAADPKLRRQMGFSHVAEGETSHENGETVVTELKEVYSVDLVADPATTAGLFESHPPTSGRRMKLTQLLKEVAATVTGRKLLAEMVDGDPALATVDVAPAAEASPEDQIKAGLMAAVMSKLEAADEATLKKVLKALGIGDSVTDAVTGGASSDAPAEETTESPTDETKAESALLARLALLEAKTLLLESGRTATPEQIAAVAALPVAQRAKLIETWPLAEAKKTDDGGFFRRPDSSPPKSTTAVSEQYDQRWSRLAESGRKRRLTSPA